MGEVDVVSMILEEDSLNEKIGSLVFSVLTNATVCQSDELIKIAISDRFFALMRKC